MKKNFIIITILTLLFVNYTYADNIDNIKRITEGDKNAKTIIIVYESLTCSHCADFHKNVYPTLKKEFIDTGLVRIEFRHFPLDLAAFNASKIAQCNNNGNSNILNTLYSNQNEWVKGKNIEEVNNYLKEFLKNKNINLDFEKCINNKAIEDYVLNDRIEGQKKFEVKSTPTIIINNKKFNKPLNYQNLKKLYKKRDHFY